MDVRCLVPANPGSWEQRRDAAEERTARKGFHNLWEAPGPGAGPALSLGPKLTPANYSFAPQ